MTRLCLGTAQWGTAYGVTNTVGRLSDQALSDIVAVAREWSITDIDTACNYGDAQRRLRPWAGSFSITTKVDASRDVGEQLFDALRELDVTAVDTCLLHYWDEADEEPRRQAVRSLRRAVNDGLVTRAGVSVYDEQGVHTAVTAFERERLPLTALQVPANVLDRRLDDSALLADLAGAGCDITVRSAFLQGILLAESGGRSDHPDAERFRGWVQQQGGASLTAACLAHVRALPWAAHVTVGVTSASELSEICEAWADGAASLAPVDLGSSDLSLIDPRRW
jgi:aryl-alcohol dehydrogenase-like predicted oxidoreductase